MLYILGKPPSGRFKIVSNSLYYLFVNLNRFLNTSANGYVISYSKA